MEHNRIKKITFSGVFAALICITTLIFRIPEPYTKGYINIGDSIIFLAAYIYSGEIAFLCGGFGSAIADLIAGYPHWAIFTFIVKGIEGFICGKIIKRKKAKIIAPIIGAVEMVIGYFLFGIIIDGSVAASLTSVPLNIIQGAVSIVIYSILLQFIKMMHYERNE